MFAQAQRPKTKQQTASTGHQHATATQRDGGIEPTKPRRPTCPCGGGCPKCRKQAEAATSVAQALAAPGYRLDAATESVMQSHFDYDFRHTRIHTDEPAGASADALGALAYTVGRDVVFAPGQFSPHTREGRRLLAHELTHVMQQSAVTTPPAHLAVDAADSPLEREANHWAERLFEDGAAALQDGVEVTPSGPRLQMQRRGAAGGCGICMGGDSTIAGQIAHTEIQLAFVAQDPDIVAEFDAPVVEEGVPAPFVPRADLTKEFDNFYGKVIQIGEIKPLDDAGKQVGIARQQLADYARELQFSYDEVFRMKQDPPPTVPFFNPMNPPGCPPQIIHVQLTEPGIYQYSCEPPFSELVRMPECACAKPRRKKDKEERPRAVKEAAKPVGKEKKKHAAEPAKAPPPRKERMYVRGYHPNFQDFADQLPYMEAAEGHDVIIVLDDAIYQARIAEIGRMQMEHTMHLMSVDPRTVPILQVEPALVTAAALVSPFVVGAAIAIIIVAAPEIAAATAGAEATAAATAGAEATAAATTTAAAETGAATTGAAAATVGTGAAITSTIEAPAGIAAAVSESAVSASGAASAASTLSTTGLQWAGARLTQAAAAGMIVQLASQGVAQADAEEVVKPMIDKRIVAAADVTGKPDSGTLKPGSEVVIDGQKFHAIVWLTSRKF